MTGADANRSRRSFRDDERSVAVVVGFLLLFAVLVLALGVWQLNVVPAESQAAESEHDREVAADMAAVDGAIERVGARGGTQSAVVTAGLSYPDRTLLQSPPPTSGVVFTGMAMEVTVDNVSVDDDEPTNVQAYWAEQARDFEHRPLTFAPVYAETTNPASRVVEPSGVVTAQSDGRTATSQRIVDGTEVGVTTLSGDLSRSADAVSLDFAPKSAPGRTVPVESTAADPLTLHVETSLRQAQWERLLREEPARVEVTGGETTPRVAEITLEPGTYDLRMAAASLDAGEEREPAYLVRESPSARSGVAPRAETVVEVRDAYNNPVPGAEVTIEVDGEPETATADAEGRLLREFGPDEEEVTYRIGTSPYEIVSFEAGDSPTVAFSPADVDRDDDPPNSVGAGDTRFEVAFTADAGENAPGLDDATIRLRDGSGSDSAVITAETVEFDRDGDGGALAEDSVVWSGPWLDAGAVTHAEVVVRDEAGRSDRETVPVPPPEVDPEPVAHIGQVPHLDPGQSFQFDATGSTGTDLTFAWDFGDGTTGTGPTPSKTYATPGTYTVTLTVTDAEGRTATATAQVRVREPLVADAGPDRTAQTGQSITFDGTGSTGPITSYEWSFGDGTTATGPTPSKTYTSPGTYTVTLTVRDEEGRTATDTATVTVTSPPAQPSDPLVYVSGSGGYAGPGTTRGGAAFQVRNDGPGAVTVTGIRLVNVDGAPTANRVIRTPGESDPFGSTAHIGGVSGSVTTGRLNVDELPIGAATATPFPTATRSTIDGGSTARVTLHEFRGGGGSGSARDMTGYTVTVELTYTVAGQPGTRTRTVTIGPLNQRAP